MGQNDSPLTAEGETQAKKTTQYLADKNIDSIYSSDLGRAVKTAEIIAHKFCLEVNQTPDFREISLGDWQGLSFQELEAREVFEKNIRPPNGENIFDIEKRALPKFHQLADQHPGENLVIVAHSITNRLILTTISHLPVEDYYKIDQANCGINEIHTNSSGFEIIKINYIGHLG